jgi:hypothetical protein
MDSRRGKVGLSHAPSQNSSVIILRLRTQNGQPKTARNWLTISHILKRFIVFPKPWFPGVLATWILGTYVFPMFQTYPYLWITSR